MYGDAIFHADEKRSDGPSIGLPGCMRTEDASHGQDAAKFSNGSLFYLSGRLLRDSHQVLLPQSDWRHHKIQVQPEEVEELLIKRGVKANPLKFASKLPTGLVLGYPSLKP